MPDWVNLIHTDQTSVTLTQPRYGHMESGAKGLNISFQTSKVLQHVYT